MTCRSSVFADFSPVVLDFPACFLERYDVINCWVRLYVTSTIVSYVNCVVWLRSHRLHRLAGFLAGFCPIFDWDHWNEALIDVVVIFMLLVEITIERRSLSCYLVMVWTGQRLAGGDVSGCRNRRLGSGFPRFPSTMFLVAGVFLTSPAATNPNTNPADLFSPKTNL